MPTVEFMGVDHEFPDTFTQEQISSALKTYKTQHESVQSDAGTPAQAPAAPVTPLTPHKIQPGKDIPIDPAAWRAMKAAGKAAALPQTEDMGVAPVPKPVIDHSQHVENVQKAAYNADAAAFKPFGGMAEEHVREALRVSYALAPELAKLAAADPDRYAPVAHQASAVEQLLTEPPTQDQISYYKANGLPVPDRVTYWGQPTQSIAHGLIGMALKQAFARAGAEIYQGMADAFQPLGAAVSFGMEAKPGPAQAAFEAAPPPKLDALKEYASQPLPGEDSLFTGAVRLGTGFVPTALELGLAPGAAFPILAVHGYGNLRMAGADPGWAMTGAVGAASIGSWLGSRFIAGLGARALSEDAVSVIAQDLQRLFLKPSIGMTAKQFGTHAASGYFMQAGMTAANEFALTMDRYAKTGKWPDVSELTGISKKIFVDSLVALPFAAAGSLNEFYTQRGRYLASRGDNVLMHSISDLVNSASDPGAASDVLQSVVDSRRLLRKLQETALAAEGTEVGPALARAASNKAAELRLTITAPEFSRAAQKMGMSPQEFARKVMLNGMIGFSDSEVLGIPLEPPIRTLAHELKDNIDGMSLHTDTPSANEAKSIPKEADAKLEAWYQERLKIIEQEQATEAAKAAKKAEILKEMGLNLPAQAAKLKAATSDETQEIEPVTPKEGSQKVQPEQPKAAPEPVRSALERDAQKTVENLPGNQLGSSIFKEQIKKAKQDFKKPELAEQAASSWERAKAAEEARKVAKKEYDKIGSDIRNKFDSDKARKEVYAGGPAYGAAYDAILGSDPDALRAALGQLPDDDTFTFDRDTLIGAVGKGVDDAPLSEMREVHRALTELRENARTAGLTFDGEKAKDRGLAIQEMRDGLASKPPVPPSTGLVGKIRQKKREFDTSRMTEHTLLQPFGSWGSNRASWFLKARNVEDALAADKRALLKAPKEVARTANDPVPPPPVTTGVPERALPQSRKDAWRVLLATGNEEDLARLSANWGMAPAEIESWLQNDVGLTKGEYDYAHTWWREMDDLVQRHAAAQSVFGGAPMRAKTPRTITSPHGNTYKGGVAPWSWLEDTEARAEGDMSVRLSAAARAGRFSAPSSKQLAANMLDPRSADVRWDTLYGDVSKMIHEISFGQFNRDTRMMLNDPRFKDLTYEKLGEDWYDRLTGWFNVAQRGSLLPDAERTAWTDALFNTGKRLAATAAFNVNLGVLAGQPSHFGVAGSRFGIANPVTWSKGLSRSVTPQGRAEAAAKSQVVPFRTRGYAEKWLQLSKEISGPAFGDRLMDLGSRPGLALQHGMDMLLTNAFWHTYKIDAMEHGMPEVEAERQADLKTDQSMPAISIMDQSALNRNRIFGAFVLVRNFPQTVWNLKKMDEWEAASAVNSGRDTFVGGYGGLAARRMGMLAGLAAGYYLMGHGRSPYEVQLDRDSPGAGTARWALRTAIPESFLYNPILHPILSALSEGWASPKLGLHSMHMFETPVEGLAGGLISDIGKLRHARSYDEWQDMAFPAFDMFGRLTGLVSPAMLRSMRGAFKLVTRDDFPGLPTAAEWLSYGPDRPNSNVFRDAFGGDK